MNDQNNKTVVTTVFLSGAFIAIVGALAFAFPNKTNEIMGLGTEETTYFAAILVFMGCVEMVLAKTVLKGKNSK